MSENNGLCVANIESFAAVAQADRGADEPPSPRNKQLQDFLDLSIKYLRGEIDPPPESSL